MSNSLSTSVPKTTTAAPPATPSRIGQTGAQWTNRVAGVSALAQFYFAGLAVFGAASFSMHQRAGWLVQLMSLFTLLLLLVSRVPIRVSGLALLLFTLTMLQPVLAFPVRESAPALAALHPVNGLAILALCMFLDRRLRKPR